VNIYSLFNDIL